MALGPTEPLHRPVVERQVDLARGVAEFLRREPEAREHAFGDPVVPLVLDDALAAADREAALSPTPVDEPELLEGRHVGERGGSADAKVRGDSVQGGTAVSGLPVGDRLQRVDLTSGQTLEKLHVGDRAPSLFMGHPNF